MPDILSPDGFARVKELFLACVDLSREEQQQHLDVACGDDRALKAQVWRMLRSEPSRIVVDTDVVDPAACMLTAAADIALGESIGPYKLREQLGEGGMGIVYVAEQKTPVRRQVALKVIKPGMDSRQVVARFEAERQALSLIDHPHIARIFDGGATSEGRPYFVMELVRGVTITEFCDAERLTIRQRLELFIQVCQAVQHAHQKGIIHRDLKPSNILVTRHDETPVPKVIDFGIAKAINQTLTDKTIYTQFAQFIGTPLYMSPEQAQLSGLDIDTRSDVYSLGVLLYELLTGTTPFDAETLKQKGLDEMRRIIREDEPLQPSERISTLNAEAWSTIPQCRRVDARRLRQLVRGELDWIVMRALEKDRNRRYQSASDLAQDVRNYLHDLPLAASPPSRIYRARKYIRRHLLVLTSITCVLLALLLGTGISLSQAYQARVAKAASDTERIRADASYKQARATIKELLVTVGAKDVGKLAEMREVQLRILREAVRSYDELIRLNPHDPEVYVERAEIHCQLKEYDQALSDYAAALRLNPNNAWWNLRMVGIYTRDRKKPGDTERALEHALRAVSLTPNDLAAHEVLADVYVALGRPKEARAVITKIARLSNSLDAAVKAYNVAFRLHGDKDDEEALVYIDQAIALDPTADHFHYCRFEILAALGRREEALAALSMAIMLRLPIDHPELNPTNPTPADMQEIVFYNTLTSVYYETRAAFLFELQRYDEALADIKTQKNRYPKDPSFLLPGKITAEMAVRCPNRQFRDEIFALAANTPRVLHSLHLAEADWHAEQGQWELVVQDLEQIEQLHQQTRATDKRLMSANFPDLARNRHQQYKDVSWIKRPWLENCPDERHRVELASFATRCRQTAIAEWEQLATAQDPKALDALAGVASLFDHASEDGLQYTRQSYEEYLKALGPENERTNVARTLLARVYAGRELHSEVVALLDVVVQQRRNKNIHFTWQPFVTDIALLATAYAKLGRHADAQRLFAEVLAQAHSPRVVSARDAIACLLNSGSVFEETGELTLAAGRYREAIERCKDTFENENPETARALALLGRCLLKQGDLVAAETALRESLAIRAPREQSIVTETIELLIKHYAATKESEKERMWSAWLQELQAN